LVDTVLVVDDNVQDVFLTQRVLKKSGIDADTIIANDGVEALDYLFARGCHSGRDISRMPTVTLLDLKMPKVDGYEVLKQVRAHHLTFNLPVVVLTSSKEDSDIIRCYELGCNAYVSKPVDYRQFFDLVSRVVSYWIAINGANHRLS
jgi:two-component system response regulator